MRYLLGVDAGGSKTHALISDETGRARGFGCGGTGNYQGVGYDGMRRALDQALAEALRAAHISLEELSSAGFGIGGYDWPCQLPANREVITSLGLTCPFEIVNDAILGLVAGTSEGWGLALVGGTGCNCRGRDRSGREGRVTGEGEQFGEWGGAGSLVDRAVQAASREWSRRGPPTALSEALAQYTGAGSLDELIEGLDLGKYNINPDWAPVVFQVANAGDEVAREAIAWAGHELGELGCGVIRQLELQDESFEIVQVGGLFDGGPLYTEAVHATIWRLAPKATFVRLRVPPVVGGVLLAAPQAGVDPLAIREEVIRSTEGLVEEQVRSTGAGIRPPPSC